MEKSAMGKKRNARNGAGRAPQGGKSPKKPTGGAASAGAPSSRSGPAGRSAAAGAAPSVSEGDVLASQAADAAKGPAGDAAGTSLEVSGANPAARSRHAALIEPSDATPGQGGFADPDDLGVAPPDVAIMDVPPQRIRDKTDLVRMGGMLLLGVGIVLVALYLTGLTTGMENDIQRAAENMPWLLTMPFSFLTQLGTVVIVGWGMVDMLVRREWIQCLSATLALIVGFAATDFLSWGITAWGSAELVNALVSANNISGILLPDLFAGVGAFLAAAGPRRLRTSVRWGWGIIGVLALVMVAVGFESLAGTAVSFCLGTAVGFAARFVVGSPSFGAWGQQLSDAMRAIGLNPLTLTRRLPPEGADIRDAADDFVPASRIYDMTCDDGRSYVVSVSDEQRHITGYLRQIWQMVTLTGISHRTDRSARESVRHHRTMLLSLRHMGLPALDPYEVTYSRESAIMVINDTEHLTPVDWATVTDNDLADALAYLKHANGRGYTNRLIHPGSFARVDDGRLVIAGWDIGDDGSNQANVAIDRIQALAALSCMVGMDRAVMCGVRAWGREEMAGLQPYAQAAVIPAETMRRPEWDSRRSTRQLRSMLGSLVEEDDVPVQAVPVTRFSAKRVFTVVLLIIAGIVIFTQLNFNDMVAAVKSADVGMGVLCFLFGCLAWVGMSITLITFMDRDKRNFVGAFMAQVTTGFTAVSMPAGVGPAFVNLQFLRKSGYKNATATAIMSAVLAVQVVATVLLIVFVGLFTGRNMLSNAVPTGTVLLVVALIVLVITVAMLIPKVRRWLSVTVLPLVKQYARQLVALLAQPAKLLIGAFGSIMQNVALGLSFWAALKAFGCTTNVVETTFIYLLGSTIGSAVPTPGGLGGVEAMLIATFTGTGVPGAIAVSATMLFRVLTYWVRIPLGALSMKWLQKHDLI